jgi:glycosyltransferase involved in cell wall biosynthesis
VLYVIDSLEVAGTERQLALTLEHLDREAFSPSVLALFRRGPHADVIEQLGVPVTVAEARPGHYRVNTKVVAEAAGAHDAKIVHAMLFESHIAGQLAAKRLGVLGVTHLVNEYDSTLRAAEGDSPPRMKALAARTLERYAGRRRGARFIAVAGVVADSGARFFRVPRADIPLVRRGFRFEVLEAAAEREPTAPAWAESAQPKLLAVGRLTPQKGHRYLAGALPRIVAEYPNAQVVIAGDGPLREELVSIVASNGMQDRLVLAGVRDDVPALMRAADVFVFPSLWEGAAGALVEALALARPVVASDIPAHRELVADTDSLVTARDSEALATGVLQALADLDGRQTAAARAAPGVRDAHDIVRNTRLLEDTYREFLAARA